MATTTLEKALKKFERQIGIKPGTPRAQVKKELDRMNEMYMRWAAEHPGLWHLDMLHLHFVSLEYSLAAAGRRIGSDPELSRIASFVLNFYDDSEGLAHNPFLKIEGELEPPSKDVLTAESFEYFQKQYESENMMWPEYEKYLRKEIERDLKKNAPGISMKAVRRLESAVKELEAKRMGIFATAALLSKDGGIDKGGLDRRNDLMLRLCHYWSGFRHGFYLLSKSEEMSDLLFAVDETKGNKKIHELPVARLPAKLYYRHKDYKTGSHGPKREIARYDARFPRNSVTDEDKDLVSTLLAEEKDGRLDEISLAITKLSPAERNVIGKVMRGEEVSSSAERKAKERAIKRLRAIISL